MGGGGGGGGGGGEGGARVPYRRYRSAGYAHELAYYRLWTCGPVDPVADGARWDKQYRILRRPVQRGGRAVYRIAPRCVGSMLEGLQNVVRCKTTRRVAQLPGLDGKKVGP